MPKKYRNLRIAFSVVIGILCLLLVALWVRSYWWRDNVYVRLHADQSTHLASQKGICAFLFQNGNSGPSWIDLDSWPFEWEDIAMFPFNSEKFTWLGFDAYWFGVTDFGVFTPHWFLVSLLAVIAAVPWVRWTMRFSLRTLIIATTVVAVALGTIFAVSR